METTLGIQSRSKMNLINTTEDKIKFKSHRPSGMHEVITTYSKLKCFFGKHIGMKGILNINHQEVVQTCESSNTDYLIYRGSCNGQGLPHGYKCFMKWTTGDIYTGDFWNGMRDGRGEMTFSDGTEYDGTWKCDRMHGQGMRKYISGNIYTGPYYQGKRQGSQGRLQYKSGDLYIGEWSDDNFDGRGAFYFNRGDVYHGSFVNNKRQGRGIYIRLSGDVDISWFVADKPKGEGIHWSQYRNEMWRLWDGKKQSKMSLFYFYYQAILFYQV